MVQWLGLDIFFTAMAQVQSLVRELRSCKPLSVARKKQAYQLLILLGINIKNKPKSFSINYDHPFKMKQYLDIKYPYICFIF